MAKRRTIGTRAMRLIAMIVAVLMPLLFAADAVEAIPEIGVHTESLSVAPCPDELQDEEEASSAETHPLLTATTLTFTGWTRLARTAMAGNAYLPPDTLPLLPPPRVRRLA